MEPFVLEDLRNDKIPKSFDKICIKVNNCGRRTGRNDYVFLLIHVLMLECGFITPDCEEYYDDSDFGFNLTRILNCVERIQRNWRKCSRVHSATYVLPPFIQYMCRVTCTVFEEDTIVNGSINGIDCDYFSLLIDPSRYVIASATNISNKFRDIPHLSRVFKSAIAYPMKKIIMRYNNVPAPCLEDLPVEILLYIMRYFDPKTLGKFERTCRWFRALCHDSVLWTKIPGGKWASFDYYKKNEIAKRKLSGVWNRLHWNRRVD